MLIGEYRVLEISPRLRKRNGAVPQLRMFPFYIYEAANANSSQGNYSAHVIKRNPWFTVCFVPVVPLSMHGYEDVVCSICNFAQPLPYVPTPGAEKKQL